MQLTLPSVGDLDRFAAEIAHQHRSHLRELRIEVVDGGYELQGRATSFYGKQIALHEASRRLVIVANRIKVQKQAKRLLEAVS